MPPTPAAAAEMPSEPDTWRASYTKIGEVVTEDGAVVAKCMKLTTLVELEERARLFAQARQLLGLARALAALRDGLNDGDNTAKEQASGLAVRAQELVAKVSRRQK